jgi:hypothetical protein
MGAVNAGDDNPALEGSREGPASVQMNIENPSESSEKESS